MFCPPRRAKKRYQVMEVCKGVYIHYFKIIPPPLFALLSFLKIISTLRPDQDQQNSIQTYCQLPITIFLWTPKCFISPESFLNFLLNLCIPPWLPKSSKFIVLRLLPIRLWVKKKLSPMFLLLSPKLTGIAHSSQTAFLKIFFPEQKKGGRGLLPKNCQNHKFLINSTIFATFAVLVYVLLCINLASSMLRCEGSLTKLIKFSVKRRMCRNNYLK